MKQNQPVSELLYSRFGWSIILIWPFLGYASVQDWLGESMLLGSIVLSGLMGVLLHSSPSAHFGFAIGLFLFRVLSNQISELPIITVLTALWIVFEGFKITTLLAGAIVFFVSLSNRGPVHQFIPISKFVTVPKEQQYIVTQKHGIEMAGYSLTEN